MPAINVLVSDPMLSEPGSCEAIAQRHHAARRRRHERRQARCSLRPTRFASDTAEKM
jgi:hypothetical protein